MKKSGTATKAPRSPLPNMRISVGVRNGKASLNTSAAKLSDSKSKPKVAADDHSLPDREQAANSSFGPQQSRASDAKDPKRETVPNSEPAAQQEAGRKEEEDPADHIENMVQEMKKQIQKHMEEKEESKDNCDDLPETAHAMATPSFTLTPTYGRSPSMRISEPNYLMPKVLSRAEFIRRLAHDDKDGDSSTTHIKRVVEENRDMEERIKRQLEVLREQAKKAVAQYQDTNEESATKQEETKEVGEKMAGYENKLNAVKETMESILHVTKQTQQDIKNTKDLVANIQQNDQSQSKIAGSFNSRFMDEGDDEMFICEEAPAPVAEKRNGQSQQAAANDDEGVSIFVSGGNPGIEYMITTEDQLEEVDEKGVSTDHTDILRSVLVNNGGRRKIRDYEKKVLQSESERINKEKENLDLKEAVMKLKRQLADKERELVTFKRLPPEPVVMHVY